MRITRFTSRAMMAIGAAWITARRRSLLSRVSASSFFLLVMSTMTPTSPATAPEWSKNVALLNSTSRRVPSRASAMLAS